MRQLTMAAAPRPTDSDGKDDHIIQDNDDVSNVMDFDDSDVCADIDDTCADIDSADCDTGTEAAPKQPQPKVSDVQSDIKKHIGEILLMAARAYVDSKKPNGSSAPKDETVEIPNSIADVDGPLADEGAANDETDADDPRDSQGQADFSESKPTLTVIEDGKDAVESKEETEEENKSVELILALKSIGRSDAEIRENLEYHYKSLPEDERNQLIDKAFEDFEETRLKANILKTIARSKQEGDKGFRTREKVYQFLEENDVAKDRHAKLFHDALEQVDAMEHEYEKAQEVERNKLKTVEQMADHIRGLRAIGKSDREILPALQNYGSLEPNERDECIRQALHMADELTEQTKAKASDSPDSPEKPKSAKSPEGRTDASEAERGPEAIKASNLDQLLDRITPTTDEEKKNIKRSLWKVALAGGGAAAGYSLGRGSLRALGTSINFIEDSGPALGKGLGSIVQSPVTMAKDAGRIWNWCFENKAVKWMKPQTELKKGEGFFKNLWTATKSLPYWTVGATAGVLAAPIGGILSGTWKDILGFDKKTAEENLKRIREGSTIDTLWTLMNRHGATPETLNMIQDCQKGGRNDLPGALRIAREELAAMGLPHVDILRYYDLGEFDDLIGDKNCTGLAALGLETLYGTRKVIKSIPYFFRTNFKQNQLRKKFFENDTKVPEKVESRVGRTFGSITENFNLLDLGNLIEQLKNTAFSEAYAVAQKRHPESSIGEHIFYAVTMYLPEAEVSLVIGKILDLFNKEGVQGELIRQALVAARRGLQNVDIARAIDRIAKRTPVEAPAPKATQEPAKKDEEKPAAEDSKDKPADNEEKAAA